MTVDSTVLPRRATMSTEEAQRMARFLIEQHVTQLPFTMVAAELLSYNLAFYLDETEDDLTRTIALLRKLVRDGVLAGIAPVRNEAGTCDLEAALTIARQLRQARAGVEGQGILATEAAEKYGFDRGNIYNWHDKGWVRLVGVDQGNRLFNEGDIAFARTLADQVGQRPGKAIFPYRKPTGRPPQK